MHWLGLCSIPLSADSSVSTSTCLPGSRVSVWSHRCQDLANLCRTESASKRVGAHPWPSQTHVPTQQEPAPNHSYKRDTLPVHIQTTHNFSWTHTPQTHTLVHSEVWPPPRPSLKCLGHQSGPLCQGTGKRDDSNPLAIGRSFITTEGKRTRGEAERDGGEGRGREKKNGGRVSQTGATVQTNGPKNSVLISNWFAAPLKPIPLNDLQVRGRKDGGKMSVRRKNTQTRREKRW